MSNGNDKLSLFAVAPQAVKLENGNTTYLRRFSAADRLAFLDYCQKAKADEDLTRMCDTSARLLAMTVCDEQGTLCFTTDEAPVILQMDEKVFETLATEALAINRLTTKASDDAQKK